MVKLIRNFIIIFLLLIGSGCTCRHEWHQATCTSPRVCYKCNKKEGNPLQHHWIEATCEHPKTCSICGKSVGDPVRNGCNNTSSSHHNHHCHH